MKVSKFALIIPVVAIFLLIIASAEWLEQKQVQQVTAGYDYKEKLFIKDEVGEIQIDVDQNEWQKIVDDPTAEEYVTANVTINGETFDNIGIRAKGNSSLTSVASSDSERYSLKIDFSQYSTSNSYYGLEKLNLNNNYSDSTQMKEFVSYELLQQMGIDVPAHSYVKVMLNGEYYGLMLAVEEIGAAFAKTHYGTTDGFIFKPEDEGADLVYTSENTADYTGIFDGAKMNEDNAKKQSNMIQMLKEISEGNTDSLHMEQVAKYFALNTALVNLDSYQGQFHHNYYLYEDADGKFSIIPWDYNMSFGGFGVGMGQGGPMMQKTTEEQTITQNDMPQMNGASSSLMDESALNFTITEPVSGTTVDARPLLQIVLQDEQMRALYEEYLQQFATEYFTQQNVAAITEPLKDLLLQAVEEDPSKFFTTEQFVEGIEGENSLATFAQKRSESILQQLAGEIEGVASQSAMGMNRNNSALATTEQTNPKPQNNGEMPEGFTPPGDGEMPEGFTPPGDGEMPEGFTPPGDEASTEQEAAANNEQQNSPFGNMPMPGGDLKNPFGQSEQEPQVTITTIITVIISLLALILAMGFINWLSNRKYKR